MRQSPFQLRELSCELGLISSVDGSARFVQGNTQVVAAVTGPAQPKYSRHELSNKCALEVVVDMMGQSDATGSKQFTSFISDIVARSLRWCIDLERYPRMIIVLKVLVECDDGAASSVAVNASIMALLDAGISMKCTPCAVSLVLSIPVPVSSSEGQIGETKKVFLLDPDKDEEKASSAILAFTVNPNSTSGSPEGGSIIMAECGGGSFTTGELKEAMKLTLKMSEAIHKTMAKFVGMKLDSSL